jgi:hypothetical protein
MARVEGHGREKFTGDSYPQGGANFDFYSLFGRASPAIPTDRHKNFAHYSLMACLFETLLGSHPSSADIYISGNGWPVFS